MTLSPRRPRTDRDKLYCKPYRECLGAPFDTSWRQTDHDSRRRRRAANRRSTKVPSCTVGGAVPTTTTKASTTVENGHFCEGEICNNVAARRDACHKKINTKRWQNLSRPSAQLATRLARPPSLFLAGCRRIRNLAWTGASWRGWPPLRCR